jgi:predicted dehydrogenase
MQKAAVIGVGSLGRHHARIYSELEGVELVAVCDVDAARAREYAEQYGCEAVTDYRDLVGRVDAASVAAPTVDHARIGCDLLAAGVAALIEKPIAGSLEEADLLVEAARGSGAALQIGHVERFNPAVRAAAGVVTTPRFIECHRLAAFTPRSLDIDVVMDLMIHDIDVILSLVDSEVAEIHAAGVGILTSRVDIANARLEFENGCIANVTASRVSSERVRKIRLFQPSDYVSIDYAAREVSVVSIVPPAAGDERPQIAARRVEVDDVEPLKAEIVSFLEAARGERPPVVSGEAGRRALDVAVRVLGSIRRHAEKVGLHAHAATDARGSGDEGIQQG